MEDSSVDSECPKMVVNVQSKPKKVMFIKGNNSNLLTNLFLRDFSRFKRPYSINLTEKYNIKPFEDASKIEALAKQNDCHLFMFSSHNKKRPNNIVIGRLSEEDLTLKEMVEIGVDNFFSMQHFKGPKLPQGSRLCLTFEGLPFEENAEYKLFKDIFSDIFSEHARGCEKLSKVDYCVKLSYIDETAKFECSRIIPRHKGTKLCKIEYEDMGPNFDFKLRRIKLFTSEALMDIPETTDEGLIESDTNYMGTPFAANNNNNNNNDNKDCLMNDKFSMDTKSETSKIEKGIKRNHDDLDERLKRMKFVD